MEPEKKSLIIIISIGAVVALGLLFFIYTKYNDLSALGEELAQLKAKTQELVDTKGKAKYDAMKKELDKEQARYEDTYRHQLPAKGTKEEETAYQELLDDLGKLAARTNIQISEYKYEEPKDNVKEKTKKAPTNYATYKWKYVLRANFDQTVLFINEIENHRRVMRITGFEIDNEKPSDDGRYGVTLEFESYAFSVPAKPAPAAPATPAPADAKG